MGNEKQIKESRGVNSFLSDLTRIFGSILSELDSISSLSESQFSVISENLQKYYSISKEISENSSEIIRLLTGDRYNTNTGELKSIFENIFTSIDKTKEKFESSETFFNETVGSINLISADVSGFKRLVKYLHIQGIATKIESSRLGSDDSGFQNLAENVDNLSIVISDKSNKFRIETESLIGIIKNIHSQDIDLKREQQENSKTILKNSRESLDLLFEKNRESSYKYEIIYANFQEVQRNIGAMVTSVQFHDITRQQIQHVSSTFESLIKKIANEADENSGMELLLNTIYNISKVQYEQLKHTRDELFNATKDIIDNLTSVSENILNMIKEIMDLLDTNGSDNHSFIEDIKSGVNNVAALLSNNGNLGKSFSGSITKVINTVESLAAFINEIGEIGSEIELISLNANIKAVHIGREGATLAVIAGEIQKLSLDARKQTEAVIQKIVKVNEHSKEFHDSINFSAEANDGNEIIQEFNSILNSLNDLIKGAASSLSLIQGSAENLQGDLNNTIKGITVHLETEKKVNRILKSLDEIMTHSKRFAGAKFSSSIELDNLSKDYTMQSQRDIHNIVTSLLNDSVPDPSKNLPEEENNNSGEFGDNVELF